MEKEKKKKKINFERIAIILIILFAVCLVPTKLQNDTFYTVSIGKQILENGIDMQDHFSWHNLPYTYPHWLYDVMIYSIYNIGGWTGVYISTCVFSAILGLCIYFVNLRLSKSKMISFAVTMMSMYLLGNFITARAQLVTFILFILLIYNIERFLKDRKIINVIALLVIHTLIVNFHVAVWPFTFVLYLPYIAEYLLCELRDFNYYNRGYIHSIKSKIKKYNKKCISSKISKEKREYYENEIIKLKEELDKVQEKNKEKEELMEQKKEPYKLRITKNENAKWLILVMLIALLTGLLTPLGKVPYTYTYLTLIGNSMSKISEHLPLVLANNAPVACLMIALIALLAFTKAKINLSDLFMLSGLTLLMFITSRQESMLVLIGSVAFTRIIIDAMIHSLCNSVEEIDKKLISKNIIMMIEIVTLIYGISLCVEYKTDKFVDEEKYPVQASEWILENLDVKNIKLYNDYNYGSYLLYKGIPVFIDSRCDLYCPEYNTPTGKKEDGYDIMGDFADIYDMKKYYGEIFEKYGVTHVILPKDSKIKTNIDKTNTDKYNLIYSDDNFSVYEVINY